MKRLAALLASVALSFAAAAPVAAQKTHHGTGTVTAVDAAKGVVTIDHEAINSINWPAMTMTFKARNKKMLEGLRPGEKVDFGLAASGKDYTVTQIQPRK